MKIRNNDKTFELTYNLETHVIPAGDMEISDDAFAQFIITKGNQWGFDVEKIGDSDNAAVKVIEAIKVEEEEKEEKEAPKTTKKTKK